MSSYASSSDHDILKGRGCLVYAVVILVLEDNRCNIDKVRLLELERSSYLYLDIQSIICSTSC